jgi:hypothetical protein
MKSLLQFTSFYFDSKKNMAAIYSSYFLIDKLPELTPGFILLEHLS